MVINLETIWLTELSLSQLNEVKQLLSRCERHDSGGPIIYSPSLLNTRLPAVNGLMYYQHNLIAFISVYFFYQNACECSLMVSPNYRNRGIAKGLLQTLIPILKAQGMKTIYFSAGQPFKIHSNSRLSFYSCEYQLTRSLDKSIKKIPYQLHYRTATIEDIQDLCNLDQACFAKHSAITMEFRLLDIVQSSHYMVLIGVKNSKCIAKAHIQLQQQAIFSDIAVLPKYQRQGYGREIVNACMLKSRQRGIKLAMLEVESTNKTALNLYLEQGFKIIKATHFWKMKI